MKLYAMTCGRLTTRLDVLMEGGEGDITVPIPSYLIDHPKGTVLFDTGMHPDCQTDPTGHISKRAAELFRLHYSAGEEVNARLAAIGRDPAKIDIIINSHLHFDHVGGNATIPNATVVVQRREWEAGMDADVAAACGFFRRDFDLGHKLKQIDGEHDLFGDGRIVCLPTHGHTPGHQSLRLRLDPDPQTGAGGGEIVLAADSCYFCRSLRERRLPPVAFDREGMLRTYDRLAALEAGGARLFFGHDPELWATVPQAPATIAASG